MRNVVGRFLAAVTLAVGVKVAVNTSGSPVAAMVSSVPF